MTLRAFRKHRAKGIVRGQCRVWRALLRGRDASAGAGRHSTSQAPPDGVSRGSGARRTRAARVEGDGEGAGQGVDAHPIRRGRMGRRSGRLPAPSAQDRMRCLQGRRARRGERLHRHSTSRREIALRNAGAAHSASALAGALDERPTSAVAPCLAKTIRPPKRTRSSAGSPARSRGGRPDRARTAWPDPGSDADPGRPAAAASARSAHARNGRG